MSCAASRPRSATSTYIDFPCDIGQASCSRGDVGIEIIKPNGSFVAVHFVIKLDLYNLLLLIDHHGVCQVRLHVGYLTPETRLALLTCKIQPCFVELQLVIFLLRFDGGEPFLQSPNGLVLLGHLQMLLHHFGVCCSDLCFQVTQFQTEFQELGFCKEKEERYGCTQTSICSKGRAACGLQYNYTFDSIAVRRAACGLQYIPLTALLLDRQLSIALINHDTFYGWWAVLHVLAFDTQMGTFSIMNFLNFVRAQE